MKNKTLRSILAIVGGFLTMFVLDWVIARLPFWHSQTSLSIPEARLLAIFPGCLVAGYIAALVAGRAHMAHALGLAALVLVLVSLTFIGDLRRRVDMNWFLFGFRALFITVGIVAGALFRYWQATRWRKEAYPSSGANAG